MNKQCHECGKQQYSIMDENYILLFGNCWSCDKQKWQAGILSLKQFEAREKLANETA